MKTDVNTAEFCGVLGFNNKLLEEANLYTNLYVGRISSQYKNLYKVMCENTENNKNKTEINEITAEICGKIRFDTKKATNFPSVGDFVMLDRNINTNGNAIIQNILTRKTTVIRKACGTANKSQIIASNIDIIFICMSLNNDFNLRRIERYLSIAWDSGAMPIIVLTKSDLCSDVQQKLESVKSVAIGVDILITSTIIHDGYLQIMKYMKKGETVAFIGSSGVGKSTLINCLIGDNIIKTKDLRNDDKGKHTTTNRQLIILKSGAMVIDTPGMREIGIETADLSKTFADIDNISTMCRFHDCTHTNEPNCAVQKAINDEILSMDRFSSYNKLKKEAGYDGLNSRQIETVKINEMFKTVGGMKNARKFAKEKNSKKGYL